MAVLVVLEPRGGKIRKVSLSAVTCGKQIAEKTGLPLHIAAVGNFSDEAIEDARKLGAQKVWVARSESVKNYTAEVFALAIKDIAGKAGAKYILSVADTFGKDLLPRVAALFDAGMASDITEVIDGETFKRPMYAGNVIATVKVKGEPKVLSVRATAFEQAQKTDSVSDVEEVQGDWKFPAKRFVKLEETKSERPELTEAEIVVSVGRGIKGPENLKLIFELADVLGAAVGASRAVVDAGWLPNDFQVGQTGKTVAPNLYIAIGISGAIQHVAGMKDSKVIVAINKDPEAPIFQIADYGLVADLFQAVPELTEKLKKLKQERGG